MGTTTFWFLLAWNGKAELLAAAIIFLTWIKAHLAGRCRLDMWIKDCDIPQLIHTISDYLETLMNMLCNCFWFQSDRNSEHKLGNIPLVTVSSFVFPKQNVHVMNIKAKTVCVISLSPLAGQCWLGSYWPGRASQASYLPTACSSQIWPFLLERDNGFHNG